MSQIRFILGGARSGKSALAERYAKASNLPVTYIATAQALDDEMLQRIKHHQAQRPPHWQLLEAPTQLANAIEDTLSGNKQGACIVVDCLTLWLSNSLCQQKGEQTAATDGDLACWQQEKQQLLSLLEGMQPDNNIELILVSNEVGHGIVPLGALSRQFVDQAGWLHQAIARIAQQVEFVIAGLPLALKASPPHYGKGRN
ncbi:adenosylcobinamide kinase /adenosylcobinamide-phosphate guanylyltransferase [Colwellia chukchiensis]|uniref:Bifunctional adenosylcobalamin biosynthesis protein n=1 Tax=Colwellia chukchiensis TaxID=641665 RepID=A0A1H7NDI0_9GAMM|nr:bifunctional adenosylcobinamide kinase/adenosylcobinamide-phosphate guanylyltransferase [Colwellia chukchiensis]SEL21622.1 adenosylcobinamide kinase /adenosylcobinamide-phosphate guanylyltransferase [Colwellia chukchiensis]